MAITERHEPVFDLIKSMSKAEKRNFKLYATRLAVNQQAKFITLFDYLDSVEEYDEAKVLSKCPIKKEQLPNMKAHLYRQILVSLRLLNVHHSEAMQLREQLDFARILYDKGLYKQSNKMLDKVREQAIALEQYSVALDVINFQSKVDTLNVSKDMVQSSDQACRFLSEICRTITNIGELSDTSVRAYSLYQKLGYARTQKDLDLIKSYFRPRFDAYAGKELTFLEKFYYYQGSAWYYYIQHDFVRCYRYSRKWVELFEENPRMKTAMYDNYIKGCSRILDGLYLMRKYRHFADSLEKFETEFETLSQANPNADILARRVILTNKIHRFFIEGEFKEGLRYVSEIDQYLIQYSKHVNVHFKMLMHYKIACLYFGDGNYRKCMEYLSRITSTKDPKIRRDLQCYARVLNLIASYEAGADYNLDYQVRSTFSFLLKMNDLNSVQREILTFLKKLNSFYADDLKDELRLLHDKLKLLENHPYERRSFYYLDILSWLESKITGKSVEKIIREKFLRLTA